MQPLTSGRLSSRWGDDQFIGYCEIVWMFSERYIQKVAEMGPKQCMGVCEEEKQNFSQGCNEVVRCWPEQGMDGEENVF